MNPSVGVSGFMAIKSDVSSLSSQYSTLKKSLDGIIQKKIDDATKKADAKYVEDKSNKNISINYDINWKNSPLIDLWHDAFIGNYATGYESEIDAGKIPLVKSNVPCYIKYDEFHHIFKIYKQSRNTDVLNPVYSLPPILDFIEMTEVNSEYETPNHGVLFYDCYTHLPNNGKEYYTISLDDNHTLYLGSNGRSIQLPKHTTIKNTVNAVFVPYKEYTTEDDNLMYW